MDLEVEWSPEAIEDIEAIAEYIARDSEYYAQAVVTEIISVSRNIGEFPVMGRMVPGIDSKLSEVIEPDSIRINDQYRICFVWSEGGADDVEVVDYH
jgi:plasmid stabilization system protein ParE